VERLTCEKEEEEGDNFNDMCVEKEREKRGIESNSFSCKYIKKCLAKL